LRASLIEPPPSRLKVGRGTAIFLHGRCEEREERVRALGVLAGEAGSSAEARTAGEEWWATVPFESISEPATVTLRLLAELSSGAEEALDLGRIDVEPGLTGESRGQPVPGGWPGDGAERVAICMCTHDPPLDLFERQISSIRDQSHRQWICLVSDDASSPDRFEGIRRILGDDRRFVLVPSEQRLGFYANFERALTLSPPEATHIALCDQDDRWYPDRLETLLGALGEKDTLAYSDMRIVTPAGELISDTYWKYRRNNWTDLGTLLIGNTITGAASIFRRSLLDYALPFPPRIGGAFHDHWLSLVALACGPVSYVDRPLHDYVQHPGVVIGFSSANADRGADGLRGLSLRGLRLAGRLIRPGGRRRYFADYCRIALLATVLDLRCGELMSPEKRAAVARVRGLDDSLRATAGLALRSLAPGNQTMGVDRSVLAGLAWSRLARGRSRGRGRR
jgi:glycosyltransferase involved in cell wall biosynthesis